MWIAHDDNPNDNIYISLYILQSTCKGIISLGFYNRKVKYLRLFHVAEEEAETARGEVAQPVHTKVGGSTPWASQRCEFFH